MLDYFVINPCLPHSFRQQVNARQIVHTENAPHRNIGKQRNFLPHLFVNLVFSAACDHVGMDTILHETFDTKLGGFGFLFAKCRGFENIRQSCEHYVFRAFFV